MSATPPPTVPTNRHALTATEKQRNQLEKLLRDPAKPAYVPPPPKEKTIRPPREMMKNVQGSSAGAGSGEFHVYKASRRREYERLKIIEEDARKEAEAAEFERKRREAEDAAKAKTSKNRAKRQKKKERAKAKARSAGLEPKGPDSPKDAMTDAPLKKRRLVNGKELVFRKPGEESDDEEGPGPQIAESSQDTSGAIVAESNIKVAEEPKVVIHEDD